jgi:glucose/mannose-6-phosphate isomerase
MIFCLILIYFMSGIGDGTMSFSLDDVEAMSRLDASRLISQIGDFLDHLETATRSKTERLSLPASVCLSGIGGSAIAADVLYDYLVARSPVPLVVNRDVNLPNWLDGTGLSIITSYSGNTQEALEIFEQSLQQGCPTYCITSGGKLFKRAEENNIPCLEVPSGLQPRAALGHLLGGAAAVLQSVDIAEPANDLLSAAINSKATVERLAPSSPIERNVAKKYAQALKDSLPVIYAPRNVRSLAVRWQNQINENAKMLAFSGEVPEMNHNQMVGWLQGSRCPGALPVFLLPSRMEPLVEKMVLVTIQMLNEANYDPLVIPLQGNNHAENLLSGIIMGDHVSYYLAMLNGQEPASVPVIQSFKERIA